MRRNFYASQVLARELEICYVNVALVTDCDAGLEGHPTVGAVNVADVASVLASNHDRVRLLILTLIGGCRRSDRVPAGTSCAQLSPVSHSSALSSRVHLTSSSTGS
jgi:hypothetical protein